MFIAMNVVAAAGAFSFGWLADRIGQKPAILFFAKHLDYRCGDCLLLVFEGSFYVVATLAGIGMGSTQSVTRSLLALFTPKETRLSFLGFLESRANVRRSLGQLFSARCRRRPTVSDRRCCR